LRAFCVRTDVVGIPLSPCGEGWLVARCVRTGTGGGGVPVIVGAEVRPCTCARGSDALDGTCASSGNPACGSVRHASATIGSTSLVGRIEAWLSPFASTGDISSVIWIARGNGGGVAARGVHAGRSTVAIRS